MMGNTVSGPIDNVTQGEMMITITSSRLGKAAGVSTVVAEYVVSINRIGIKAQAKICYRALADKNMPDDACWLLCAKKREGICSEKQIEWGFMPGKETVGDLILVRMMREKKLQIYYVDLEKAFNFVPRQIKWMVSTKEQSKQLVEAVMKL